MLTGLQDTHLSNFAEPTRYLGIVVREEDLAKETDLGAYARTFPRRADLDMERRDSLNDSTFFQRVGCPVAEGHTQTRDNGLSERCGN